MQEPDCVDIEVFVGVDIAKGDHYACVVTSAGAEVLARSVRNDEAAIGRLIDDAAVIHGTVALVIDTTSSAASLLLETAARREVPVAYVTGLAMRRAADLYAGAAKTDPKDAAVLADYARRNADRLSWTTPSGELLVRLRILNGRDADLAADATRAANRLRDALLTVSPALERALGDKLADSGGARDALAALGHPHSAHRAAGGPHTHPHRQTLAPHSGPPHRRHLRARWTRRATRHRRGHLGRHHHRARRRLGPICARRDQLATTIEAAFMDHPLGKVLASLCGFGPRTGARTLAEIGDPTDSPTAAASQPAAYAGLAPVDWQSGRSATVPQTPRRQPPPQKRHVHRRLRRRPARPRRPRLLPAQTLTPPPRQTPQRRRRQPASPDLRRCNIILAMLKTQTPYQTATTSEPAPSGLTTRQGHLPLS